MLRHEELLTIGRFAQLTSLSIKALRLYDRLEILPPIYIDPESNYRYYGREQIATARLIRTMRQMDMPLNDIRKVLEADNYFVAESVIRAYEQSFLARARVVQKSSQQLLENLRGEKSAMSFTVSVQEQPEQLILSISKHVYIGELDTHIEDSKKALQSFVETQGGEIAGAPFGIFHSQVNQEENGRVEVCLPVKGTFDVSGDIVLRQLPAGKVVSTTADKAHADFPEILGAYDTLADWIQQHGHQMIDSPREVWLYKNDDEVIRIDWPFAIRE